MASLGERILGRVSVHDIIDPISGELIVASGEEIDEVAANRINESPIESVEIRSVLTCESKKVVGASEPGTQLTLRTFHVGGVASNIAAVSTITSRYEGVLEIEELRTVETAEKGANGKPVHVVIGRLAEMRIIDPNTKMMLTNANIPYGSKLYFGNGDTVTKGDVICEWDPFNAVIISEVGGKIEFQNLVENVTYRVVFVEQNPRWSAPCYRAL